MRCRASKPVRRHHKAGAPGPLSQQLPKPMCLEPGSGLRDATMNKQALSLSAQSNEDPLQPKNKDSQKKKKGSPVMSKLTQKIPFPYTAVYI